MKITDEDGGEESMRKFMREGKGYKNIKFFTNNMLEELINKPFFRHTKDSVYKVEEGT